MPNPRDIVDYTDIGAVTATFKIDGVTITYDGTKVNGSLQVGLAVTFSAANTVALTEDGNAVVGKLLRVDAGNEALVQISGYMTLPGGDGAALTRGKGVVGDLGAANAKGYVREVATATAAELGVQRGFIQDASVTTAVLVCL